MAAERWRVIAEGLLAGRIIPFLGAGASSFASGPDGASPPSGNALLATLAEEAELAIRCGGAQCARTIYDLSRVASYYTLVKLSRRELDRRLGDLTGNPLCQPNALHRLLARVAAERPMLAVTTNYDALLERAFDDAGADYEVVATAADRLAYRDADDDTGAIEADGGMIYHRLGTSSEFCPIDPRHLELDLRQRSVIYKVHGSVPCGNGWSGGYLIAEEDYTRFLGRMDRNYIYPFKIKTIMRAQEKLPNGRRSMINALLFLGYSLNDWNLRVLMDELGVGRGLPGEERHYAILKTEDSVAKDLLDKRNISVRYADLGVFVQELGEALALMRAATPAPAHTAV